MVTDDIEVLAVFRFLQSPCRRCLIHWIVGWISSGFLSVRMLFVLGCLVCPSSVVVILVSIESERSLAFQVICRIWFPTMWYSVVASVPIIGCRIVLA